MSNVLPGVAEVFANFLLLHNILIRLDLPTFDLPIKAYSGLVSAGHIDTFGALIVNSAFFISIDMSLVSINPWSKNSRPHSHHGASALHGNGIVITHSPRTLTKIVGIGEILMLHLVEKPSGG